MSHYTAYTLIRAQVLEEAAAACEGIEHKYINSGEFEDIPVASGAQDCAQALREIAK